MVRFRTNWHKISSFDIERLGQLLNPQSSFAVN